MVGREAHVVVGREAHGVGGREEHEHLAHPMDDHEFRHVCAQMRPTSVPRIEVPQSRRRKGKSP